MANTGGSSRDSLEEKDSSRLKKELVTADANAIESQNMTLPSTTQCLDGGRTAWSTLAGA